MSWLSVVCLTLVVALVMLVVLATGVRLEKQKTRMASFLEDRHVHHEVRRQLRLAQLLRVRALRRELREAVRAWSSGRSPLANPRSERLRREIAQLSRLVARNPDILLRSLRSDLEESVALEDLPGGGTKVD